jgi:pyridinium-3,5-biscarboxylic acid mononucleotide sulfurtransferase
MSTLQSKYKIVQTILTSMNSVLVAFSGGVDSTLLLKIASDTLPAGRVLAVIAESSSLPDTEKKNALATVRQLKVRYRLIKSKEMDNLRFSKNDSSRCYWCKKELFQSLKRVAREEHLDSIIEGSNYDDRDDYRPGMKAVREQGARSPLQEAGLTKDEIRKLSCRLGLATWDKPSAACLASRVPYGTSIDSAVLKKIERAEQVLRNAGFSQVRVRHYGQIARIEVAEHDLPALLEPGVRKKVITGLKKIGYLYITADLEGYRTGSMNKVLIKKNNDEKSLS